MMNIVYWCAYHGMVGVKRGYITHTLYDEHRGRLDYAYFELMQINKFLC